MVQVPQLPPRACLAEQRVDPSTGPSHFAASVAAVRTAFAGRGEFDDLDGLTVTGDGWWFNVRPSNTEPLLRLNAEADDTATLEAVRDEVLAVIREGVTS